MSEQADGIHHHIATLICGAGRIGIMPLPDDEAIADIAAWRASLVISMTTGREMTGPLGPALAEIGAEWVHLPIVDFGAPDETIQQQWNDLSPQVHARLDAGQGVIVHCRAGCGRSGMIALRLLVERGDAPAAALSRLRAVHPCAVETPEQYEWAALAQTV